MPLTPSTFSEARRAAALWMLAAVLVLTPALVTGAQSPMGETRRQATRAEIELAVKASDAAALQAPDEKTRMKHRADAAALRARLTNGDFAPGDRIMLEVVGDTVLTDTFTVRGDRILPLANVAEVSLQGVLDSELEAWLTRELLKYIRQVTLTATPLVRLSLIGFQQSNFYTLPVDRAITDVISAAGGWAPQVAWEKTVVRRAGTVVLDAKATGDAIRQGKTVGDMSLRDGDELFAPAAAAASFNWQNALAVVSSLTGIYFLVRYGIRGGGRRIP